MENTTGPVKVFFVGTLPKETYTDVNELAKDIANNLAVDADSIVVPLIPLEDLKGEQGEEGPRGLTGSPGAKGDPGAAGPTGLPGSSVSTPFKQLITDPTALTVVWVMTGTLVHQNAKLTLVTGTGSQQLVMSGAIEGMHGTLLLTQNELCNGQLGLPVGSKQDGDGWNTSKANPPTIPVPATPFIDILHWVFDGTTFFWTIDYDF